MDDEKKKEARARTEALIASLTEMNDPTMGIRCVDDYNEDGVYMPGHTQSEIAKERKLKEDLMKKFPRLYADRTKPMTQTCMCWGLDVGVGWLPIIDELSMKLEVEIDKFLEENEENLSCECGHLEFEHKLHEPCMPHEECTYVFRMPIYNPKYRRGYIVSKHPLKKLLQLIWNKVKWKVGSLIYKSAIWLANNTFLHKKQKCHCGLFSPSHPRAAQVKEKLGGLRFYMTFSTDKMEELIGEAESKCDVTCEDCGKPGELCIDHGWLKTLCPACVLVYKKEGREYIQCSKLKDKEDEQF